MLRMGRWNRVTGSCCAIAVAGFVATCLIGLSRVSAEEPKKEDKKVPLTPPERPQHPPMEGGARPPSMAKVDGKTLTLDGVTMTIPDGWESTPPPAGPMSPIVVFKLTKAEGEPEDGTVRITHFPNMKGMDDANIDRWLKSIKQADGKPHTRESAKITTEEKDHVKVTIVDITGTLESNPSMGTDANKPGTRMIAAIVDHPQGPHYVRAVGTVKTLEKWQQAVDAFVKSAKIKQ